MSNIVLEAVHDHIAYGSIHFQCTPNRGVLSAVLDGIAVEILNISPEIKNKIDFQLNLQALSIDEIYRLHLKYEYDDGIQNVITTLNVAEYGFAINRWSMLGFDSIGLINESRVLYISEQEVGWVGKILQNIPAIKMTTFCYPNQEVEPVINKLKPNIIFVDNLKINDLRNLAEVIKDQHCLVVLFQEVTLKNSNRFDFSIMNGAIETIPTDQSLRNIFSSFVPRYVGADHNGIKHLYYLRFKKPIYTIISGGSGSGKTYKAYQLSFFSYVISTDDFMNALDQFFALNPSKLGAYSGFIGYLEERCAVNARGFSFLGYQDLFGQFLKMNNLLEQFCIDFILPSMGFDNYVLEGGIFIDQAVVNYCSKFLRDRGCVVWISNLII
jgi:hypothetical protein